MAVQINGGIFSHLLFPESNLSPDFLVDRFLQFLPFERIGTEKEAHKGIAKISITGYQQT